MKYLLVAMLLLTGCTSKTEFGSCIGIGKEGEDPALIYKVSTTNVVVGVVFAEMIFPTIIVALDELYCPVGRK